MLVPNAASPPSPSVTSRDPPSCTYAFIAPNCGAAQGGTDEHTGVGSLGPRRELCRAMSAPQRP
eukprot:scaffold118276_cov36-Phaeocystis_antarctica.AAC.1